MKLLAILLFLALLFPSLVLAQEEYDGTCNLLGYAGG